jgi:hypothetical protein
MILLGLWSSECDTVQSYRWLSFLSWQWMRLSALVTAACSGPVVPVPDGGCFWSCWWNKNWQGCESTRKDLTLVPLCPPQILHNPTWDRSGVSAVRKWRLTAWVVTWVLVGDYGHFGRTNRNSLRIVTLDEYRVKLSRTFLQRTPF